MYHNMWEPLDINTWDETKGNHAYEAFFFFEKNLFIYDYSPFHEVENTVLQNRD